MLLQRAGIQPEVRISGVDEDAVDPSDAHALVAELARRKATAVAATLAPGDHALVIGCDSVLDLDGAAHGKPGSARQAVDRWQHMRGRAGILRTGHHLVDAATGSTAAEAGVTTVYFTHVTDVEIEAYVASGEPIDVAGAFTLEGRGSWFVPRIDGDPGNVMGLSLPVLRRLLARLGCEVTDLWT